VTWPAPQPESKILLFSKIAFSSWRDSNSEIYVREEYGSSPTRLTINSADDSCLSRNPIIKTTARPTLAQDRIINVVEFEKGRVTSGIDGLNRPNGVTISPDGAHVYVAGNADNAIAVFSRNGSTGELTFAGAHFNGEDGIEGLDGPNTIVISPDGKYLYVSAIRGDGVVVFRRNSGTGALTYIEFITNGIKDLHDLDAPVGITISPDGQHVYLCGRDSDALAVFSRDNSTGLLTFAELIQDNVDGIDGLDQVSNVIVSQDGKHVYTASQADDAVAVFTRDENTGLLTFVEIHKDNRNGVDGLNGAFNIIESPDRAHIYVTAGLDDALAVFSRNSGNGALTFVEMQQNGVNGVEGLYQPLGIDFSSDGKYIFVAGTFSDAVVLFSRDSSTGALTFVEAQTKVLNPVLALDESRGIAVSPDGAHVYVTGRLDDALNVFGWNTDIGKLTFLEVHRTAGGLESPRGVTVSPDGKYIYASSFTDNSVSVFHRDTNNGALTLIEKYCNGVDGTYGLEGALSVIISPDGAHLYIMAYHSNAVAVFTRNISTGKLTFVEAQINGVNGVEGLKSTMFGHISSDGKHLYATGFDDHALVVFRRDIMTGQLTFIEKHVAGVNGVEGISQASGLTVSPDGKNVYVDGKMEGAIAVFSRDENTGQLRFMEIHKNNVNGVDGLDGGSGDIEISADGKYLYAAGFNNDAIVVFSRNTETGELTFVEFLKNGLDGVRGLDGAWRLALNPDGSILYVTGRNDHAVAFFGRNTTTGKLTFLNSYKYGIDGISISPDGLNIYVACRQCNHVTVLKLLKKKR